METKGAAVGAAWCVPVCGRDDSKIDDHDGRMPECAGMSLELLAWIDAADRVKLPGARHTLELLLTAFLERDPGPDD